MSVPSHSVNAAQVGDLLASVAPFDACLSTSPQRMTPSAWPAMKALKECAFDLGNELRLSNVAIGLDLDVEVRQMPCPWLRSAAGLQACTIRLIEQTPVTLCNQLNSL